MKKIMLSFAAASLFLFGVSVARGMDNEIIIKEKPGVGKYLTDNEGRTLYWFIKDSPGKSACDDSCVEMWPVYYRDAVAAPAGIKPGDFATITRDDGLKQTTFRGYPLYYSINDKDPGDMNRQHGINLLRLVINPDNFPPKPKDEKKQPKTK